MSHIVIDEGRCKGCALCTHVCPHDLVQIAKHFNAKGYLPAEYVDPQDQCTACANCATMCPDLAITVYRTRRAGPGTARAKKQARPRVQGTSPSNR
jgi:2-oxoglutarate ferredoxin oxidoreductase subunit delta